MFKFLEKFLEKKKIFIIYRIGNAIGDQVCMSAIIEKIYEQKNYKSIVITNYPEIFYNNPNVLKIININKYSKFFQKKIISILKRLKKKNKYVEEFRFQGAFEEFLRKTKLKISLIEIHSYHFDLQLNLKNAKPKIYFSNDEIEKYEKKFNNIKNFAIIQPQGKITYTPNKEWGFDKYQKVVDLTKNEIRWVQVGLSQDKLLKNVIDLRGKTDLRELFYLVKKANFVLSNEGLLNHIAAGVETKSFVIFSGFSNIELAKYDTTIPIVREPQIKCAPCWLLEKCPINKKCLEEILPEKVVNFLKLYI